MAGDITGDIVLLVVVATTEPSEVDATSENSLVVVRTPQGGAERIYWKGKRLRAEMKGYALVLKGEEFDLSGSSVTFKGEVLNVHWYDGGDVALAYDPVADEVNF